LDLDRLGGELEGQGAVLELVVVEGMGVLGGGEVGGELADFGVDGLMDRPDETRDVGSRLAG
jgi:hypothetical protein